MHDGPRNPDRVITARAFGGTRVRDIVVELVPGRKSDLEAVVRRRRAIIVEKFIVVAAEIALAVGIKAIAAVGAAVVHDHIPVGVNEHQARALAARW